MATATPTEGMRAGVYRRQSGGYEAFFPEALRPGIVRMNAELAQLLSAADRALGRLDGAAAILPNPDLFVAMYSLKEALLSSQIEGTQASLVDVLQFEAEEESKSSRPRPRADVQEVLNHQRAMYHGLDRLRSLPISNRLLKEIHEVLMAGVRGEKRRPGEFRQSQVWVGPPGSTVEEATFIPPPVPAMKTALGELEDYIHADNETPIVVKSGLVHYQFETIHPFEDGNGRMGRLLITFLLAEKGVLERPLLYLSVYLKEHKKAYYELLNHVRDTGDFESWTRFFLRGIRSVSLEATETARRILKMRDEHLEIVRARVASGHAPRLLERLMMNPVVTAKQAARDLDISYPTANNLIGEFEKLSLLREVTGRQRYRVFIYQPYIDELGGTYEPEQGTSPPETRTPAAAAGSHPETGGDD